MGDENKSDWNAVYGVAALMALIFLGLAVIDFNIARSTPVERNPFIDYENR